MTRGMEAIPTNWHEQIINLLAERIVVTDREGTIIYINEAYCEFLGTTVEEAINRPVQDVIENSRMHIVAKTGKKELAALHPINGSEMIANRYPLFVDGKLVGALGTVMFRSPEEWRMYKTKIQHLVEELKYYKTKVEKELKSKYYFQDLIGSSQPFLAAKNLAERISASNSSVLLIGESGTGKELFAHAVHNHSLRSSLPFVAINCASIPEHLLESELFGYDDGAFTGAKKGGKKGQFEMANNGTLFLDEIGDMPLSMQSKLLRVLQEKEVQRVGGQKSIPVDVRIIAATHRDLEKMVDEGKFRRDLYYRLNVIKIEIPSLNKRKEDIKLISMGLLKKLERKFFRTGIEISKEVEQRLMEHSWPGNIRELENVLERAINVLDGQTIEVFHLPLYLRELELQSSSQVDSPVTNTKPVEKLSSSIPTLKETLAQVEKEAIINALTVTNGNKQEAARLLEIGKTRFYEKCKLYNIK
ncbi:sigma-54-dependent Fis family transcriptional regulator [Bacillus sp. AFS076308]|uniref:sigma-54 interaction domain-containing protein n=1 Tax=unclassified Bacillus (in: firmicutes) TaxID=185979 RepID=UPI000BF60300|nr:MULTISPECIES: sigma 54-interacting transcriptional regulator [unclassified Bacillus (in: firmicutes)]PFN99379.1 sigma-54-dependent Fis family transcriptional regulator [Bacillus sp. AFS076308]PGV55773.1 sigma-54-dependent Fis family transcriptional regulator [Bacillus sp. AFS037270]